MTLDQTQRQAIIGSIADLLVENYVYPEKGVAFASQLREQLGAGKFDDISDTEGMARRLTKVLHEISDDKHFSVQHNPSFNQQLQAPPSDAPVDESDGNLPVWMRQASYENYHFKSVERLTGNVGYMDVRLFLPAEVAGDVASAAMNFLSRSDALIFDLRKHQGGSPTMIQLISTYLFSERDQPKHLNSFYFRPADTYTQTWTLPHVSGARMPDIPVVVLTSALTGSAGEEFTYNLKHMERATIIGETTAGAAHPVAPMALGDDFVINMPMGRAINPITETNWEGVGVEPHISVPQEDALKVGHIHALETMIEQVTDDNKRRLHEWALDIVKAEYEPMAVDMDAIGAYVGQYANLEIKQGEAGLMCRQMGIDAPLLSLESGEFALGEGAKIRFADDGASISLTRRDTGQAVTIPRNP